MFHGYMPYSQNWWFQSVVAWNLKSSVAYVEFSLGINTIRTDRPYGCIRHMQDLYVDPFRKKGTYHQMHNMFQLLWTPNPKNQDYDVSVNGIRSISFVIRTNENFMQKTGFVSAWKICIFYCHVSTELIRFESITMLRKLRPYKS